MYVDGLVDQVPRPPAQGGACVRVCFSMTRLLGRANGWLHADSHEQAGRDPSF